MASFLLAGRLALCWFVVGADSSSVLAPDRTVPMLRRDNPDGEFAVIVDSSGAISNDPGHTGVNDGIQRNFVVDTDPAALAQEAQENIIDDDDDDDYYYYDGGGTGGASCTDANGWTNGHGHGCESYTTQGWCENGKAKPGNEWTLGATYKYPESNCCVCGKHEGSPTPPPTPPPTQGSGRGNLGGAGKCPGHKPWLETSMCVAGVGLSNWGYHCSWEGAALCSAKRFGGCHDGCQFDCVSTNVNEIIQRFERCSTAGTSNCHVSTAVAENTVCCWKYQCQGSNVKCGAGIG